MKRNLLLLIGIIAILFPMNLKAQDGPKISGFVQGMYIANLDEDGDLESNQFQMRRVRMSVTGTLFKNLSYKVQGDFTRKPMLVDVFVKYKVCDEFAIQVGQFKLPFTYESPLNPVDLEIFDYGEAIKHLVGYKDVCGVGSIGRDLGIMATGNLFKLEGKDFPLVSYSLGLFNGNGANEEDNNNRKDVVGRLDIHPMLKDLTLTGSYYYGLYLKDAANNGDRTRWSAGAQYNDGRVLVRGEYISGNTGYSDGTLDPNGNPIELTRFSTGYYAVAGYNFLLGKDKSQKLMPVLRYEFYQPGDVTGTVFGSTTYYTAGINYWPLKSLNLKLDYTLIQNVLGSVNNSHRVVAMVNYKF